MISVEREHATGKNILQEKTERKSQSSVFFCLLEYFEPLLLDCL